MPAPGEIPLQGEYKQTKAGPRKAETGANKKREEADASSPLENQAKS